MAFVPDSFMSGQVTSKLWLCEQLELTSLKRSKNLHIAIYAGWYGLTNLLLRSRNNLSISRVDNYDLDPSCEAYANMFNENWIWQYEFFHHVADVNEITWNDKCPDVIINTACEHMDEKTWFESAPSKSLLVLQSNDMHHHEEHQQCHASLTEFENDYPLANLLFKGSINFSTGYTHPFNRFMLIGYK